MPLLLRLWLGYGPGPIKYHRSKSLDLLCCKLGLSNAYWVVYNLRRYTRTCMCLLLQEQWLCPHTNDNTHTDVITKKYQMSFRIDTSRLSSMKLNLGNLSIVKTWANNQPYMYVYSMGP